MPRDPIDTATASRERLRAKKAGGGVQTTKGGTADTSATDREDLSDDLGSGKAARGGGAGMPKQEPGEDPAAYGERLRRWRASQPKAANQAKALGGR